MSWMGYDPERVHVLRQLASRAIDALAAVRSDDPEAADAMAVVRGVRADLEDDCLALTSRVLQCEAMLAAIGAVPVIGRLVDDIGRAARGGRSATDVALVHLLHGFEDLDLDGDGELTGEEIASGRSHPNADVRAACTHVLARPLTFLNVAGAGGRFTFHEAGDDIDLRRLSISATAISHALAQNEVLRLLADPATFAALDRQLTNEFDGLVSAADLRGRLVHEVGPQVRGALELALATDLLGRIDRDHLFATSDGTIAYDQVAALAAHQGALEGLPDPTIPAALSDQFGAAESTGDRTPQFLHHEIPPQPGFGRVVIALYIPTATAGLPGPLAGKSAGNDRGPDPHAHPSDSKVWALVDFEQGLVTARVNPSCSAVDPGACQDPLPITTDFGVAGAVLQRIPLVVDDSNRVGIDPQRDRTRVRVAVLNSDKRVLAPTLDAEFDVRTHADGTASVDWRRDAFPALEAYHLYPDGRIVQLADDGAGPVAGLLPFATRTGNGRG
jgi:hypothetical protein